MMAAVQWQATELEKVSNKINSAFMRNEKKLFASEGVSGGSKWKALSPRYAAAKRRKFGKKKIMVRTGTLRRSLTTKASSHIIRYTMDPNTIEFGTKIGYAAYHIKKKGNPHYNPRLPHRDTLQHRRKQVNEYRQVIWDYITGPKMRRANTIAQAQWNLRSGKR